MSDTKMIRHARSVIKRYFKERQFYKQYKITTITPRCFVVGRSQKHLMVSRPYLDYPEHLAMFVKQGPVLKLTTFDKRLEAGDWCIVTYVSTRTSGEIWAIKLEE